VGKGILEGTWTGMLMRRLFLQPFFLEAVLERWTKESNRDKKDWVWEPSLSESSRSTKDEPRVGSVSET